MKFRRLAFAIVLTMGLSRSVRAQVPEPPELPAVSAPASVANGADPHPELSVDSTWAAAMVIVIAVLFLSAAVIGPVVRSLVAEEMPELHAQEEQDARHASQHEPGHAASGHS